MTATRHWVAYDLDRPSAPHIAVTDPKRMEDYRAIGYTIEGPFVHADQLTGTVEALAELVRLKDGPRDDAYRAAKDAAWDAARAALPSPSSQQPKETR